MNKIKDFSEKRCAVCGKTFVVQSPSRWGYKEAIGKQTGGYRYRYFCSWKCLRADEAKRSDKEKKKMEKEAAKKNGGRTTKKTAVETADKLPEKAQTVELVYDPSIKEEYMREQAAREEREARGRRIAEKLDMADRARREMIDGIEPLMPKVLESRAIPGAVFAKRSDGMVLYNEKASIDLTAYQWFKLTEEILVAIRQLDITSAEIEGK